jgi:flagellar biosynthesis/type III secretory pathway protein FliH
MTPAIPPDAAFAIGGRVPAEVAELLAEARRIRDGWAAAVREATQAASTEATAQHLAAFARWRSSIEAERRADAVTLAVALAERALRVQLDPTHLAATLDAIAADASTPTVVALHPDDATALEGWPCPDGFVLRATPGLQRGDLIVSDRLGRRDLRLRTRLEGVLPP